VDQCIASTKPAATLRAAAIIAACWVLLHVAPAAAEDRPAGCTPPPDAVTVDPTPPINIGILANALIYYRCTQYDADVTAALAAARDWVAKRAAEVTKPAIVLDIDETSLSNWEEIFRNNFGYIPYGACDPNAQSACGQHDWELSARAVAIEPTLELFNVAQTLKGKNGESVDIYFITGRFEDPVERAATEWNLHKVGYDKWRQLFMRDAGRNFKNVSIYKTWARTQIETDHIIIANVGDQLSDLVGDQSGDHAERCFKVPNPFYFIAGEPVPAGGLKCLANK
jgi:predicted secreted acid phosphatase